MNQGLDAASGEYIGIVEPDDYVPLNMYEDLYKKAKEYELDFVKADFYRFVTAENGNKELYYNHLSLNRKITIMCLIRVKHRMQSALL